MDIESYAKHILETEFGYSVEKIAEGADKSPDFLLEGHSEKLLVELKSKFDDTKVIASINEVLGKGEIAEFSDTTGRKNTISKIITDSSRQLASLKVDVDYRLVWLLAVGKNQKLKKDQFKSSLYGSTSIFDLESTYTFPCYYFGLNDFYRVKDVVDGALISTMEEGEFCLNTFSPGYPLIQNSYLANKFAKACCDPIEEEKRNEAMIVVDNNINRRDKRAVMRHLQTKYGKTKIQDMQMNFHSATVAAPKNKDL